MKKIITLLCLLTIAYLGNGQNLQNISGEKDQALGFSVGYNFAVTTELTYLKKLNTNYNSWLNLGYSKPFGAKAFDDYKTTLGFTFGVKELDRFKIYTSINATAMGLNAQMVKYYGVGSDLSITAGYYATKWYLSGELGSTSSVTYLATHTEDYKNNYPDAKDGLVFLSVAYWKFGLNTGFTLTKGLELNIALGMTKAMGQDGNAKLPYYTRFGLIKIF